MGKLSFFKKISTYHLALIITCLVVIIVGISLNIFISGCGYEAKKFKQFIVTFIFVMMIRIFILDHIGFMLLALYWTFRGNEKFTTTMYRSKPTDYPERKPIDNLKHKLISLKADLELSPEHRDEELNVEYRTITQDLWLFGRLFILIMILVIYSLNTYAYHNSQSIRNILITRRLNNFSLEETLTISNLYTYINSTLIYPFNQGKDYNDKIIDESGWMNFQIAKLIGIIRLQQVRHTKIEPGMQNIQFDEKDYKPGWKPKTEYLPYVDKYWRTFRPWMAESLGDFDVWLVSQTHYGKVFNYWNKKVYMTLLARDVINSEKILSFLKEYKWFDKLTAAVFIDFTLYNVDSNLFTTCSILLEQTPFGNLVWQVKISSSSLLTNMNEFSFTWWFIAVVYVFVLIQLAKSLVITAWYKSGFWKHPWNWMDIIILILNFIILILMIFREYLVKSTLHNFEYTEKLNYIDFRLPTFVDYSTSFFEGFLVACVTIRLWKILKFARMFRLFTRTLFIAARPILWTLVGINVLLIGVTIASQIINGSHTENFTRYFGSLTTMLSYSFGFTSRATTEDLSHGGTLLGVILYIILMWGVAIFLINMFITLIVEYFAAAREVEENIKDHYHLPYYKFLAAEYKGVRRFFRRLFPKFYKRQHSTVYENIRKKLDTLEAIHSYELNDKELIEDNELSKKETERAERMEKIGKILNTQLKILHHELSVLSIEFDSDEEIQP